ncbi:MAG: alpha-glucuronidase, partial [Clostridia bacterium]|nr:alpha-glucuronidase [Clostridia bacterium]
VIDEWIRLTYTMPDSDREKLLALLLNSRHVYELYTATLGLCWMITPHTHYGPNPDGYEYDLWGTYHRADRNAVGIDRTALGTGYTAQYPPELQAFYENRETCPDELLLFFHRVAYDAQLHDGRTLIQRIYDDHFEGCAEAEKMAETLQSLPLPETDRQEAVKRMAMQLKNAREWRDVINTFFYRFSGAEDEQGRTIYP